MKALVALLLIFFSTGAAAFTHLVNGCRVFTMEGLPVKTFPGNICLFFPDGSLVSASEKSLIRFSPKDEIQWEIPGNFHHQLELDHSRKHILAMGNVVRDGVRSDTFVIIDLAGRKTHETNSEKIYSQVGVRPELVPSSEFIRARTGAVSEAGHFNSFYEIPAMVSGKGLPEYLKQGNFVVNALSDGVFVLSADLSKVLHHFRISQSHDHQIHDVQVRPSGEFVFFNNRGADGGPLNRYSAIQILDSKGKLGFSYTAQPREFFYSQSCGGVQELDSDLILFSDVMNATYFYSRKKQKLEKAVTGTHRNPSQPWNSPTQRVKAWDLRDFLRARALK